jgi:hypothetical protein
LDILGNSIFQFIITTSLTLLLGGISVWLAMRRPVQIPLTYEETQVQKRVDPSNEEVTDLLAAIYISPDDRRVQYLNFVTFKLWNSGKESVTLTDEKPLSIAFKGGATILACQEIETSPQDLEYSWRLEDEKLLLAFPLLDPKDSATFRVLITGGIHDFPDISVRVPGRKRIVRANNIQQSKEMSIIATLVLCLTTYSFVSTWALSPSSVSVETMIVFYGEGMCFLVASWLIRRSQPGRYFPSELLWGLIKALPLLIPLGILAALIEHWLGRQTLFNLLIIIMCLFITFSLWLLPYACITRLLEKKKTKYNPVLIGVLASIPSFAFLGLCVRVFLLYWW